MSRPNLDRLSRNVRQRLWQRLRDPLPELRWAQAAANDLARRARLSLYHHRGGFPWTEGYEDYRRWFLERALRNEPLLDRFRNKTSLPARYGVRLDERVVEYPWALTRLSSRESALLDAGSVLNHDHLLRLPVLRRKRLTIVTLAPEPACFWFMNVSYQFADLRALPFDSGVFDEIVCLSTLEHVGFDTSMFGAKPTSDDTFAADFAPAVQELARVLRPGGKVLISVPFGRADTFPSMRQFTVSTLQDLVEAFGPVRTEKTFFRWDSNGWNFSEEAACSDCAYFDFPTRPYNPATKLREYDSDLAAAARAVACLDMTKG